MKFIYINDVGCH